MLEPGDIVKFILNVYIFQHVISLRPKLNLIIIIIIGGILRTRFLLFFVKLTVQNEHEMVAAAKYISDV